MMDYYDILEGGTFTFKIGPEEKCFVIHRQVVEGTSPALAALMDNGSMEESTLGEAKLKDTDPRTFALFAEFAYTGSYCREKPFSTASVPLRFLLECNRCAALRLLTGRIPYDATIVRCNSCLANKFRIEEISRPGLLKNCSDGPVDAKFTRALQKYGYAIESSLRHSGLPSTEFNILHELGTRPRAPASTRARTLNFPTDPSVYFKQKERRQARENDAYTILSHAKVYVFCQEYLIDDLKHICLEMLNKELQSFNLTAQSVHQVLDLLIHVYNNTAGPIGRQEGYATPKSTGIELREVIVTYVVANAKRLNEFASFKALLDDGGEFVSDIYEGMAKLLPR